MILFTENADLPIIHDVPGTMNTIPMPVVALDLVTLAPWEHVTLGSQENVNIFTAHVLMDTTMIMIATIADPCLEIAATMNTTLNL